MTPDTTPTDAGAPVRSKALLAAGDQLAKRLEHIMEFCGSLTTKARCDIGRDLERWDAAKAANKD